VNALTVWQPWASFIVYLDKRIENRTWRPPAKLIGQRIAIHAGKRWDHDYPERHKPAVEQVRRKLFGKKEAFPQAAILGTALLAGYAQRREEVPLDQERWFAGPFGWILGEVRALETPIPCLGAQGVWSVPPEIEAQLAEVAA
jgi:hypothetical protein